MPDDAVNGYGEHNIQGIGDKHIPLIHNVMNTDFVVGVSDGERRAQPAFQQPCRAATISRGRRKIDPEIVAAARRYRPLRPRQHRRRDQACQASRLRPGRRHHDDRDRQRRAVRQRAAGVSRAAVSRTGSTRSTPAKSSAGISKASPTITCSSSRTSTGSASSTSATTPGSSSRACRSRTSTAAGTRLLARAGGQHPRLGPADRRISTPTPARRVRRSVIGKATA